MTDRPIGFNAIVERGSRVYGDRMRRWVDVALEEGVRFFITALGNPAWVCARCTRWAASSITTSLRASGRRRRRARRRRSDRREPARRRARGARSPERSHGPRGLGSPIVCAGGVGDGAAFAAAPRLCGRFSSARASSRRRSARRTTSTSGDRGRAKTTSCSRRRSGRSRRRDPHAYIERSARRRARSRAGCSKAARRSTGCARGMR